MVNHPGSHVGAPPLVRSGAGIPVLDGKSVDRAPTPKPAWTNVGGNTLSNDAS
jgi:hypothetical protein